MLQLSLSRAVSLLVCDELGHYRRATTAQILEGARRAVGRKMKRGAMFVSPEAVQVYLRAKLAGFEYEVFAVLFLDAKHRLIQYVEMFRGTVNSATVYPREVVREALRLNAAAAMIVHNHPSGCPEPSAVDLAMTKRLRVALDLVDVRLLDHFIVGGDDVLSLSGRGLL